MGLDRLLAEVEAGADLAVRQALGDELSDLPLAGAQLGGALAVCGAGAGAADMHAVESITTYQASTMIGTDAGEHLEAFQTNSTATLTGNGGDDTLKGSGGQDVLAGGAGADTLDAGYGDDTITGGPGRDAIFGDRRSGDCGPMWCTYPYGNDTIDARDGEVDSVSCGAGADTVKADPSDVVAPDCETVERGTAAPDSGPQPKPVQGGGGGGAGPSALACVMPNVRGLRLPAAKKRLKNAGCTAVVRYARSRKVARGKVLRVSAKRGKRLARGARVTLTISRGR